MVRLLIFLICLSLASTAYTATTNPLTPANIATPTQLNKILIVINKNDGVYKKISELLEQSPFLTEASYQVTPLIDDDDLQILFNQASAIVTIGSQSADTVYRLKPKVPILSALITKSGFEFLASKHFSSVEKAQQQSVSAILLDQPLERLYHLGTLLVPDAQRAAVLSSDFSSIETHGVFSSRKNQNMTLNYVSINNDSRPLTELKPVIKNSDFVITLPGKNTVSVSAARWILHIGSLTKTPIIAYSKRYVQSGALAAVYTSKKNVADEIIRIMQNTQSLQKNTAQLFTPQEFSIEINSTVARVLGITIKNIDHYHIAIQQLEGSQ